MDASALVEVLLRRPVAERIEERLFAAGETLHAPHLLDLEVVQTLRRHVSTGQMTPGRALAALEALVAFPLKRYSHHELVRRIWELRHVVTAYDAAYLTLAEVLGAPLLTTDKKLAGASGHDARIELIESA
ncbi:MAG: type II toxin-antitoxin system VapC family toxin [Gammaproteobacteria bacterium]